MRPVSRGNSRRATWVGPHAEHPRFPGPLLRRTRDALKKDSRGLCRGAAGNPRFPRLLPEPSTPLYYYGGEFIVLRGDKVKAVNEAYRPLWEYNLQLFADARPKLNEEALFFSVLAERLHIRNDIANRYTKRMWTSPRFNNVKEGDESLAVWHLPYEKKRGLYYLYRLLRKQPLIADEKAFWKKAAFYTGIPRISARKKLKDLQTALWQKIRF